MSIMPLVIGFLVLLATGRALVIGAASADGDSVTRESEPLLYWSCVSAGLLAAVVLLYIGLRGAVS